MMKTTLLALALSMLAGAARAQSLAPAAAQGFGAAGQIAVQGDFDLSVLHHGGVTDIAVAPAADYFLAPHLSLGGQVIIAYSGSSDSSTTSFGLGPRVGYDIPLSDLISFWPQGGFSVLHESTSLPTGSGNITHSDTFLTVALYAPFLFHPVPHFFIGLGPSLSIDVAGGEASSRETTVGLRSTVGGYFDW